MKILKVFNIKGKEIKNEINKNSMKSICGNYEVFVFDDWFYAPEENKGKENEEKNV